MGLIVIFNIFLFIYSLSIRQKTINELNSTTKKLTNMYNSLVDKQDYNQSIASAFARDAKNKVYELSLILLNIKSHYEETLELTDDYLDADLQEELKKNIKAVENQLKEIGFINNKEKVCKSIVSKLYFEIDHDFSKN